MNSTFPKTLTVDKKRVDEFVTNKKKQSYNYQYLANKGLADLTEKDYDYYGETIYVAQKAKVYGQENGVLIADPVGNYRIFWNPELTELFEQN